MAIGDIQKQVRMVFDLNKCLGCHSCTMACKTMWTDRSKGMQYMYWNNVETQPGMGYPKGWRESGKKAGFKTCDTGDSYSDLTKKVQTDNPLEEIKTHYGAPWEYNYDKALPVEGGKPQKRNPPVLEPKPLPTGFNAYASNWDEDVGDGEFPNSFYFYLPRICNHCSKPACVAACPRQAAYKREEDGIVLIDQERCRGYRYCVKGCPYKKSYYNETPFNTIDSLQEVPDIDNKVQETVAKKSQKCIFCYPRIEKFNENPATGLNPHSFCFTQCVGRIRYVGYYAPYDSDNNKYNVNRLIDEFRVGLRLHPEFGTNPNCFYIPPMSPPKVESYGVGSDPRLPAEFLATYFGDDCDQSFSERVVRINEIFETISSERDKVARGESSELIRILTAHSEADRLQLNL